MTRAAPFLCLALLTVRLAAFALISVEEEIAIRRQAQQQVGKDVAVLSDRAVAVYVASIGKSIASRAGGPRYPYNFSIANYKEINASEDNAR